jgi:hypothetical protein
MGFNHKALGSIEVRLPDGSFVEYDLDIRAEITPYSPGCLHGPPEKCYPPEGGECEEMEILLDGRSLTEGELAAMGGDWESYRRTAEESFADYEPRIPDYDDYDRADYFGDDS